MKKLWKTQRAGTGLEQNRPFAVGCNFGNSLDEKMKVFLPDAAKSLILKVTLNSGNSQAPPGPWKTLSWRVEKLLCCSFSLLHFCCWLFALVWRFWRNGAPPLGKYHLNLSHFKCLKATRKQHVELLRQSINRIFIYWALFRHKLVAQMIMIKTWSRWENKTTQLK